MKTEVRERKDNIIYLFLFFLMSFVTVLPFLHYGKIFAVSDWSFHASRVEQIYRNLKEGQFFTFIATSTFNHSGVGSFLFYPTVFIYPWAFFRLVMQPVSAFYCWYFLVTFGSFVVSYYCMKRYSKDSQISFIFSLIYILNNYRLYLGHAVFGEFIATGILPIVFLGFYETFFDQNNKYGWVLLAVGMALITYSHLVSLIIIIEIFTIILFASCFIGRININFIYKWKQISASIGLWFLLSLPLIYLFITNYIGKNISAASFGVNPALVPSLALLVSNSFKGIDNYGSPQLPYGIGLILILTLFLGWYKAKKNKKDLYIYLLGALLLLVATNLFPWNLLKLSPFGIIQLPIRYLSYSCLFLSVIASEIIHSILKKTRLSWILSTCLLVLVGVSLFSLSESKYISLVRSNPVSLLSKKSTLTPLPPSYIDNRNYEDQFNYTVVYGETDYFPKAAQKYANNIVNQIGYVNGERKRISVNDNEPNKLFIRLKLNKRGNSILPIVAYRSTIISINGKNQYLSESKQGMVYLPHLRKGINDITVGFNPGIVFYALIIISITTWLVLLLGVICKKVRNDVIE